MTKINFNEIRKLYRELDMTFYDPYPMDWIKIFSPIEYLTWSDIREYNMKMYPQYPIGKYFADFANIKHKIVIECDGKKWHDPKKDKIRDQYMIDNGWIVYRITGSECFKQIESRYDYDDEDENIEEKKCVYWEKFYKTGSGVVKSIYYLHYKEFSLCSDEYKFALNCLDKHRSKGGNDD